MRFLIIEDDLKIAESLSYFFRNNHYAIDVAYDGETGLRLALNTDYDLIITDNILPKINGQAIIYELRKNKKLTPILSISILNNTQNKIDLLKNGADDCLTKPFSFGELHARVKALLRRPQKIDDSKLSFRDLTLDLLSHEAQRANHQIYLTTKEFSILRLFMESPGLICSRQIITEQIWDDASNHLSNVIEAHILHLRHKIDFKKPFLIQTVAGRGYKLNLNN